MYLNLNLKIPDLYNTPNQEQFNLPYHYLSVGIIFAESIEDDVGGDANHTEDTTLGAPADHLNSEGVFLHQVGGPALTRFWLLKHFGSLQFVQHLQRDYIEE